MWELIAGRRQTTTLLTPHDSLAHYAPHRPWPKQQAFLDLTCREALYGGAAGGGKSEALLMAALEYVHVPGYAALILRRDTQRLHLSGGLIPRSQQWLAQTGAVWRASEKCWTFPTGGAPATLRFGYLLDSGDRFRYGSSEFQYIAFDELTEFPADDYLFLFSRLRRTAEIDAPLRMRAASNPGNLGHNWVKQRFIPAEAESLAAARHRSEGAPPTVADSEQSIAPPAVFWKGEAAYVPARIDDNPALNAAEYRTSLMHLPPLERERLMNGDWSVREEGLIRPHWLRYFTTRGEIVVLHGAGERVVGEYHPRDALRLSTIDPAGTSAERAAERRGRPPSWSVISTWEIPPGELSHLRVLRHVWRERVGFDGLCQGLRDVAARWRPVRMLIENEKLGQAAVDVLGQQLPLRTIATGRRDKVARAAPLIAKLERGEVFLPRHDTSWRCAFEAELLAWSGLPEETSDQIDAAAYAMFEEPTTQPLQLHPLFLG